MLFRLFFATFALLFTSVTSIAAEQNSQAKPGAVMLILDASGSMWGQIEGKPKIEIARETIAEILGGWNQEREIGLMAYGHRRKGDCADIEQLIPVGPLDRDQFMAKVSAIVPKGKTPLTDSVELAAKTLRISEEPASVILISDGQETCDRDPCVAAEKLAAQGIDFKAHVVGFDIKDEDQKGLRCLADKTGGAFVAAGDAAELKTALQKVVDEVEKEEPEPKPKEKEADGPGTLEFTMLVSEGGEEVEGYYQIYLAGEDGSKKGERIEKGAGPFELEPGKYFVDASWNRSGVINARTSKVVEVNASEKNAVEIVIAAGILELTLLASEGGDKIPGYFTVYEAGKSLSGQRTKLEAGEGPFKLKAGDYFLEATWNRSGVINARTTAEATVKAGETTSVEMVVNAGVLNLSMVAAEGGDEIEGYYHIYEPEKDLSGNRKKLESSSDKKYNLKEGKYLIVGSWGRYNDTIRVSEEVEVKAGQSTSAQLVANAGMLALTTLSADEKPVEADYKIYEAEKNLSGERKLIASDDESQFKLPQGKYFITATKGDATANAEVEIAAGKRTEQTLTFE